MGNGWFWSVNVQVQRQWVGPQHSACYSCDWSSNIGSMPDQLGLVVEGMNRSSTEMCCSTGTKTKSSLEKFIIPQAKQVQEMFACAKYTWSHMFIRFVWSQTSQLSQAMPQSLPLTSLVQAPQGNLRLRGRGLISTSRDKMRSKNRLICQDITGKDVHILLRPARSAPFLRLSAISLLRRQVLTEDDATDGYLTISVSVQCTSVQMK